MALTMVNQQPLSHQPYRYSRISLSSPTPSRYNLSISASGGTLETPLSPLRHYEPHPQRISSLSDHSAVIHNADPPRPSSPYGSAGVRASPPLSPTSSTSRYGPRSSYIAVRPSQKQLATTTQQYERNMSPPPPQFNYSRQSTTPSRLSLREDYNQSPPPRPIYQARLVSNQQPSSYVDNMAIDHPTRTFSLPHPHRYSVHGNHPRLTRSGSAPDVTDYAASREPPYLHRHYRHHAVMSEQSMQRPNSGPSPSGSSLRMASPASRPSRVSLPQTELNARAGSRSPSSSPGRNGPSAKTNSIVVSETEDFTPAEQHPPKKLSRLSRLKRVFLLSNRSSSMEGKRRSMAELRQAPLESLDEVTLSKSIPDNASITSTASSASIVLRKLSRKFNRLSAVVTMTETPRDPVVQPLVDQSVADSATSPLCVGIFDLDSEDSDLSPNASLKSLPEDEINVIPLTNIQSIANCATTTFPNLNAPDEPQVAHPPLPPFRKSILKVASGSSLCSEAQSEDSDVSELEICRGMDELTLGTTSSGAAAHHKVRRSIQFSPQIRVQNTWDWTEYDRRSEVATSHRLDGLLAKLIKAELNAYKKNEMPVHEESRIFTQFY